MNEKKKKKHLTLMRLAHYDSTLKGKTASVQDFEQA